MREILYKAKDIDTGEWVYGAFVPDALEKSHGDMVTWGFIRFYNNEIGKMETIEVERDTVCEYTGLTDKNGKKIFEGDMVKRGYDNQYGSFYQNFLVEYSTQYGGYITKPKRLTTKTVLQDNVEVIGNIHDSGTFQNGNSHNESEVEENG